MHKPTKALKTLKKQGSSWHRQPMFTYAEFLEEVVKHPEQSIRNAYQVYADMIKAFICDGVDEYVDDPESIHYLSYNCNELFVEGSDRPFFADRLFANRLIRHVESLSVGTQQNKIFIFEGPHGSGKSTFLNNLLRKFQEYANTPEGARYEVVWRFARSSGQRNHPVDTSLTRQIALLLLKEGRNELAEQVQTLQSGSEEQNGFFDVPCPSHDNPILLIPKELRRQFFDDLFENEEFKWKLYTEKKYDWVFREEPCTICSSIYQGLQRQYKDPLKVMEFAYARPYIFRRRLGEGISVYNPGDKPVRNNVVHHPSVQRFLDRLFSGLCPVHYIYSNYAKTNNGIYALMDIKSHNTERLMELHNIISDGVHKVEDVEERVNSLFFALMNPEDKKVLTDLQAFRDRIEYINIPYVLDLKTEVDIYREVFGKQIDENFLPRVLHNFARVIIATRLKIESEAMLEWIGDPENYELYCDKNLQLLKMEVYTGFIPPWLSEKDVEAFTARRRRKIIAESEKDGWSGLSGRDSLNMFNEFYSTYAREDQLIDMSKLGKFFRKYCKQDPDILPKGFLDSLLRMYNYVVLQEVKESIYYYNEDRISNDIKNYMFAVNFEPGSVETCTFTGEKLEVGETLFQRVEAHLLVQSEEAAKFRTSVQKSYTTVTLPQEILRDNLDISETALYLHIHERYIHNLKEKVLEPFLQNENFRRAIKDFDKEAFKTYDKKIQDDVTYLMENLQGKYGYSRRGAKEICIYVIDNDLASVFRDRK